MKNHFKKFKKKRSGISLLSTGINDKAQSAKWSADILDSGEDLGA